MQIITLSGNLVRDPEVKVSQSGTEITKFSVAANRRKKNQQGEWENTATFFDCTAFGNDGKYVSNYLTKGRKVLVVGDLEVNVVERDGVTKSYLNVVVKSVEGVDAKPQADQAPAPAQPATPKPSQAYAKANEESDDDFDIFDGN